MQIIAAAQELMVVQVGKVIETLAELVGKDSEDVGLVYGSTQLVPEQVGTSLMIDCQAD